jgi:hypothetical protein
MAMPANITVAVSPISGVLTSSLSRMTDDTGRTIPNPRPPVNMAARIAGNGFNCFCVFMVFIVFPDLLHSSALNIQFAVHLL